MDEKLKAASVIHKRIEIPEELSGIVDRAIAAEIKPKRNIFYMRYAAIAAVFILIVFVTALNTSQAFAESIYEIPVLSRIAKLFTFTEYSNKNEIYDIEAEIPAIQDAPKHDYEAKINKEISSRMDAILAEAQARAEEFKKAFVETGGKEEEFIPIKIKLDYELKYSTPSILSFIINKAETSASAYNERYFYNLDLVNEKDITLQDLLGENFRGIADTYIKKQIDERNKASDMKFFEGDMGFMGITEKQSFYINNKGNVVIVFAKYEIAPGAMGAQEFEIPEEYLNR